MARANKKKQKFIIDPGGNGITVLGNCVDFLNKTVLSWCDVRINPPLIVTIERYLKPRRLEQNAYMWAALMTALERSGVPRPGSTDTMSKEGWHFYLRIELGYIIGTEDRYLPGGYKVECPVPQPTADGADGQMTEQEHHEYCSKVIAFMDELGVEPTPYEADDYSGPAL